MRIKIEANEDVNTVNKLEYKVILSLSGDIQISQILSEYDLNTLLDDISFTLGYKPIMEKFKCSLKDAKDIKNEIEKKSVCKNCDLKMVECYRCCKICESQLEQDLFKALVKNGINVELQMRINKDNTISHYPEEIDSAKILTIPDFYLESDNKKICIYTDGHTYHERTEYQAVRDRSIDRDLQNLGYIVLRYTTSEIKQKLESVVVEIKKTIGMESTSSDNENSSNSVIEKISEGTCIRCGWKIDYNPNRPLCEDCYQIWVQFSNIDYVERFCHKCGKEFMDCISYRKPLCRKCSY